MYNELGIIQKALFCIIMIVPLLYTIKIWRLTYVAMKLFIYKIMRKCSN